MASYALYEEKRVAIMAYDEKLAQRIRQIVSSRPDIVEKKMFGGLSFLVQGNMLCGVLGEDLIIRTGPKGFERALAEPHVRPMDFSGQPVKGMVFVSPEGCESDEALSGWVQRGLDFALSLPPK